MNSSQSVSGIMKAPRMNWNRRTIVIGLLCLVISALVSWLLSAYFLRKSEPTYQGKTATAWLQEPLVPSEGEGPTLRAFRSMGPRARPFLVKVLQKKDSMVKRIYNGLCHALPEALQRWLPEVNSTAVIRARAAWVLGQLGDSSEHEVNALIVALKASAQEVRISAIVALMRIRPKPSLVLPALITLLDGNDDRMRLKALRMLSGIGPEARPATPVLERLLNDKHESIRLFAAEALLNIDQRHRSAVQTIIKLLGSTDSSIRRRAQSSLRRFSVTEN